MPDTSYIFMVGLVDSVAACTDSRGISWIEGIIRWRRLLCYWRTKRGEWCLDARSWWVARVSPGWCRSWEGWRRGGSCG